jgi:hypothetical protein
MRYFLFLKRRRTAKARSFVCLSRSPLRQPFFPATPRVSSAFQFLPLGAHHKSRRFILLQTLWPRQKTQPLCNQANPHSLNKIPGVGATLRLLRALCGSALSFCLCVSVASIRRLDSTCVLSTFRMNTCESVSKQMTLIPFRMNTCEKPGGGGCYG